VLLLESLISKLSALHALIISELLLSKSLLVESGLCLDRLLEWVQRCRCSLLVVLILLASLRLFDDRVLATDKLGCDLLLRLLHSVEVNDCTVLVCRGGFMAGRAKRTGDVLALFFADNVRFVFKHGPVDLIVARLFVHHGRHVLEG